MCTWRRVQILMAETLSGILASDVVGLALRGAFSIVSKISDGRNRMMAVISGGLSTIIDGRSRSP
jgi:hypothetical protein